MDHNLALSGGTEAAQRPLGNTAKSSSGGEGVEKPANARLKRVERYQALSQARAWLWPAAKAIGGENPGDVFRTIDCRWSRRSENVEVHFSSLHQSAHYGKLTTCGSVWACPVCCATIQQRRRPEVAAMIEWAYGNASQEGPKRLGEAQMVTFTFPHTRFDSLSDLLAKQRQAFKILRSGDVWQRFKSRYGFSGLIRSLELTVGRNGWHPHTHELWATRPLEKREQAFFVETLRERWLKACTSAGLLDGADSVKVRQFLAHSVDVRFKASGSDYLAKQDSGRAWGVDREIASSSSKAGRASGIHPHELLVRQAPGDAALFLEFVQGMKGQRQLYWSSRLKGRVGLQDKTDEDLVEEETEQAELLGLLTPDQWRLVRGNDARAELLNAAELAGWVGVLRVLRALGCQLNPYEFDQLQQVDGVLLGHFDQAPDCVQFRHFLVSPRPVVPLENLPPASSSSRFQHIAVSAPYGSLDPRLCS